MRCTVFSACINFQSFKNFQRRFRVENAFASALLLLLYPAFPQTIKSDLAVISCRVEKFCQREVKHPKYFLRRWVVIE